LGVEGEGDGEEEDGGDYFHGWECGGVDMRANLR
jgi:hypothetical protein